MTRYEQEQAEYEALMKTPDAEALLGTSWKPLPAAPVAPAFDQSWLPRPLRNMAQAVADNMSVPIDLPSLVGVGVASACACGRVSVRLKPDWVECAQLYLLGVMESGSGKSPVFNAMTRVLYRYQADENKRRAKSIAADNAKLEVLQAKKAAAVKQKKTTEACTLAEEIQAFEKTYIMRRFIGGDATPESIPAIMKENGGATSILDDEGTLFELLAGRYQDLPNLEPYLQGYSGGKPISIERKSGSVTVDKPALSLLALTQPYIMQSMLSDQRMRGKGLLSRFLVYCPAPLREYGEEPDIPAATVQDYEEAVHSLLETRQTLLELSSEAKALFFSWRDEIRRRQWDDWDAIRRDGYSEKLAGNTARIAACLHLWEAQGQEITATTMRKAIAMARYFVGHLLHLLGTECGLTLMAKEALEWMVQHGQVEQKEREIKRALNDRKLFRADGAAESVLDELEKAGYIKRKQQKGIGRPVLLVKLHPDLLPQKEVVDI